MKGRIYRWECGKWANTLDHPFHKYADNKTGYTVVVCTWAELRMSDIT